MSVHEAAARGFGAAAEAYDRARPDYPDQAIDRLIQELEINRAATLLDLAAGTGKLTRQLIPTGARVVAVEPVEAMRARLPQELGHLEVVAAVAEALPFGGDSFDGVLVAQAFHWFDGARALGEIHRVLKPSGRLALLWNVRDESVEWVRRLGEIFDRYEREVPREKTGEWRRAFTVTDYFGTLHQLRFQHAQRLDRDGLVERVASTSFVASLAEGERDEVLQQVRGLADEVGDEIVLPYVTELYWTSKI
ncbi:MAG TPA: class I SAM-dependent methyltransferase [Actinomycetota bacterium]|nr:class I SAM-dependent methyltransferase [Actinomycetota bacterium]